MSIYTMMDQHGMHSTAEQDRNEHQQVKQLMAHLDSHGISTVGLDEYAKRVVEACELFLRHADVCTFPPTHRFATCDTHAHFVLMTLTGRGKGAAAASGRGA
jgi:hypothetical protein